MEPTTHPLLRRKIENPRVIGISQARMGSRRLTGKTLTDLLGKNILQWHSSRVLQSKHITDYVVATSTNPEDDAIEEFCSQNDLNVYRGSSDDVLSRFLAVAKQKSADVVVRMTADCPLIDPELIDCVIGKYLDNQESLDYVSLETEYYLRGFDVEVISREALDYMATLVDTSDEREHVTLGINRRPEIFNRARFHHKNLDFDEDPPRLCVDTSDDLAAVKALLEKMQKSGGALTWQNIMAMMREHPEITEINKHIKQLTF